MMNTSNSQQQQQDWIYNQQNISQAYSGNPPPPPQLPQQPLGNYQNISGNPTPNNSNLSNANTNFYYTNHHHQIPPPPPPLPPPPPPQQTSPNADFYYRQSSSSSSSLTNNNTLTTNTAFVSSSNSSTNTSSVPQLALQQQPFNVQQQNLQHHQHPQLHSNLASNKIQENTSTRFTAKDASINSVSSSNTNTNMTSATFPASNTNNNNNNNNCYQQSPLVENNTNIVEKESPYSNNVIHDSGNQMKNTPMYNNPNNNKNFSTNGGILSTNENSNNIGSRPAELVGVKFNTGAIVSDAMAKNSRQLLYAHIYNYLIHNGYFETARIFLREAEIPISKESPNVHLNPAELLHAKMLMNSPETFLYEWWESLWNLNNFLQEQPLELINNMRPFTDRITPILPMHNQQQQHQQHQQQHQNQHQKNQQQQHLQQQYQKQGNGNVTNVRGPNIISNTSNSVSNTPPINSVFAANVNSNTGSNITNSVGMNIASPSVALTPSSSNTNIMTQPSNTATIPTHSRSQQHSFSGPSTHNTPSMGHTPGTYAVNNNVMAPPKIQQSQLTPRQRTAKFNKNNATSSIPSGTFNNNKDYMVHQSTTTTNNNNINFSEVMVKNELMIDNRSPGNNSGNNSSNNTPRMVSKQSLSYVPNTVPNSASASANNSTGNTPANNINNINASRTSLNVSNQKRHSINLNESDIINTKGNFNAAVSTFSTTTNNSNNNNNNDHYNGTNNTSSSSTPLAVTDAACSKDWNTTTLDRRQKVIRAQQQYQQLLLQEKSKILQYHSKPEQEQEQMDNFTPQQMEHSPHSTMLYGLNDGTKNIIGSQMNIQQVKKPNNSSNDDSPMAINFDFESEESNSNNKNSLNSKVNKYKHNGSANNKNKVSKPGIKIALNNNNNNNMKFNNKGITSGIIDNTISKNDSNASTSNVSVTSSLPGHNDAGSDDLLNYNIHNNITDNNSNGNDDVDVVSSVLNATVTNNSDTKSDGAFHSNNINRNNSNSAELFDINGFGADFIMGGWK